jgi:hypothetical protein
MSDSMVTDLNILRPKRHVIKLSNKEFDFSFIPVGMTFECDNIVNRIAQLDMKKLEEYDIEETKKAFNLSLELCSTFTSFYEPDMDIEWFKKNSTAGQVGELAEIIKSTLEKSYEGLRVYGKN